jgi:ArsR family transcriptional regulator
MCDCDAIHIEIVERVQADMLPDTDFSNLTHLFKMFSDNTRLRILWALSKDELCVCDLAALLDMTKSAVSHQLKTLRLANLVKSEKRGREVYYSLADCHTRTIFENGLDHTHE